MLPVVAALAVQAPLPAWWLRFPSVPRLEAAFVQESGSAVFGTLRKHGRLQLASGGRLRVAYQEGLLVVSDGRKLVQYDPDTRTAQGLDLRRAARDFPLLNLLLNPADLAASYEVQADGQAVVLRPRLPGQPEVRVEPAGALPGRIAWTDGTGSRQVLTLVNPKAPAALPDTLFRFEAPKGTRWLGKP